MLHRVSPAKPNALPGDVLALTTATMVVPMPGARSAACAPCSARRGSPRRCRRTWPAGPRRTCCRTPSSSSSGTSTPSGASCRRSARAGASSAGPVPPVVPPQSREAAGVEVPQAPVMPGQYAPRQPSAGRYGVPTQVPGYDAARRSPVGMRYLGGIFHDSSGESSFYDPSTESLVPMGAAAFSASDFRRTAPAITRPVPPPRTSPRTAPLPRDTAASPRSAAAPAAPRPARAPAPPAPRGGHTGYTEYSDGTDDTKVLTPRHWSDHHPRPPPLRRGRRRGRLGAGLGAVRHARVRRAVRRRPRLRGSGAQGHGRGRCRHRRPVEHRCRRQTRRGAQPDAGRADAADRRRHDLPAPARPGGSAPRLRRVRSRRPRPAGPIRRSPSRRSRAGAARCRCG